jgi:hypothetical protein
MLKVKFLGKPYAGKLHVRFDEGGLGKKMVRRTRAPIDMERPHEHFKSLNPIFYSTGQKKKVMNTRILFPADRADLRRFSQIIFRFITNHCGMLTMSYKPRKRQNSNILICDTPSIHIKGCHKQHDQGSSVYKFSTGDTPSIQCYRYTSGNQVL